MSYESRVIVVNVNRHEKEEVYGKVYPAYTYAEEIASVKMGQMNSNFPGVFKQEIDYTINTPGLEGVTDTDKYGDHIKSAKIEDVIAWLEQQITKENYRRLSVLLGLLKGFDPKAWDCLEVLHYGY